MYVAYRRHHPQETTDETHAPVRMAVRRAGRLPVGGFARRDPRCLRRRRHSAQRRPAAGRPGARGPAVGGPADRRARLPEHHTGYPSRRIAGGRRRTRRDHRNYPPGSPSTPVSTRCGERVWWVTLNDAQRDAEGRFPRDASPDDLVVHQQDIDAVLNALWSSGAEGIQMQDQRIIGTSAPRCVGNTLLLNGRTYSPPYVITAIGDAPAMRAVLSAAPLVTLYRQYVVRFGLEYTEEPRHRWIWSGTPSRCGCASPSPWDPSVTSDFGVTGSAERDESCRDRCGNLGRCRFSSSTTTTASCSTWSSILGQLGRGRAGVAQRRRSAGHRRGRRPSRRRVRRRPALPRARYAGARRRLDPPREGLPRRPPGCRYFGVCLGPPGHRRGLRRHRRPGARAAARQDRSRLSHQCRCARRTFRTRSPRPATTR